MTEQITEVMQRAGIVIECGDYLIYPYKHFDGTPSIFLQKRDGEGMELSEKELAEIFKRYM